MEDKMFKMLAKRQAGKKAMTDVEKDAKMSVVDAMKRMAEKEMGSRLSGLKKVTVAADSKEGLEDGLSKAEELMKKPGFDSHDEESEEEEMGPEQEEGHEEDSHEEMTPEELDAKIQELMKLKEMMKSKA